MSDLEDKLKQTDSFWCLDDLIPPKKKTARRFSSDTEAVEIDITKSEAKQSETEGEKIPQRPQGDCEANNRLNKAREALIAAEQKQYLRAVTLKGTDVTDEAPIYESSKVTDFGKEDKFTYTPEYNSLIKSVTVSRWYVRYSFYERFYSDALRLYDAHGTECENIPFFSYTPQYSQLSKEQLNFYLYFRELARKGEYIDADYSYILLYLYEIINLPEKMGVKAGTEAFCGIASAYKEKYPKILRLISEWLCDYCLIHKTALPDGMEDIRSGLTAAASLKPFYVDTSADKYSPFAKAMFEYGSNYNYRSSKFMTPENRILFDKHIPTAFLTAFTRAERENFHITVPIGEKAMVTAKTVREAFPSALCVYSVKRKIEVTSYTCSRKPELRFTITDAVKYCENQVRSILGIKSRFHTPSLPPPLKQAIDEYFAPLKKSAKPVSKKESAPPEYEKLYEPVTSEFSLDRARDIEKNAWATTSLLTADTEDMSELEGEQTELPTDNEITVTETEAAEENEADLIIAEAINHIIDGDTASFDILAKKNNMLRATLAETVNEYFYGEIGDAVIEESGSGYIIIEDYREEIDTWIKSRK